MAGFIINIGNVGDTPASISLMNCIKQGIYITHLQRDSSVYTKLFSDFLTANVGDNIYFFCNRNFYGIGEIVNVGIDCKYANYIGADNLQTEPNTTLPVLIESENAMDYPFLLTFKPSPYFFCKGVDMDALLSYHPEKSRMIRVMQGRSFMKIDDIENDNLKDFIIRANAEAYIQDSFNPDIHFEFDNRFHSTLLSKLTTHDYTLHIENIIDYSIDINNPFELSKEDMLQALVIYYLQKFHDGILGDWDFVTREYFASPFKIALWSDKMDVFAYKHVGNTSTICKYLIIELKKSTLNESDVFQTLKYVDWVCKEFANGDYSMIEAYTIGLDYDESLIENLDNIISKKYIRGFRPYEPDIWRNLRLLKYTELYDQLNIPYKNQFITSLIAQLAQLNQELQSAQDRLSSAQAQIDLRTQNGKLITQTLETEFNRATNKVIKIQNKIEPILKALDKYAQ